jgi:hypothetical protein
MTVSAKTPTVITTVDTPISNRAAAQGRSLVGTTVGKCGDPSVVIPPEDKVVAMKLNSCGGIRLHSG